MGKQCFDREIFLNVVNASGLSLDDSYKEKFFEHVRNMLNGNSVIYDIDVEGIEPRTVISCLMEEKHD